MHPSPGSGPKTPLDTGRSRREFLQSAAVAGVAAAALPLASMADSGSGTQEVRRPDPMEEMLSRYGSEFGDLTRIR